ncbi:uncharacterized protein LOC129306988 isoform X1 [Prosopis cineraria]|uniref:uncharacterized protein LOC129306988 isoform X1 n=1 Tax=Prosopis cineraria TaxID=364024 RepID=UPI00240FFB14|nr:uncharacterized protein LOC129306988 isoform X1 [Prosopis cineraria]
MTTNPKHTLETDLEFADRHSKIAKTEDLSDDDEEQKPAAIHHLSMSQNPRIQRYLLAIEYIGTHFSGSQKQLNCRTVVGVLQDAFHKFIGQPVSISLSSRTDAGVHALSNVCHVDIERISKRKPGEVLPPHEPAVVRRAVNHFLQKNEGDISIIDVRCVPSDFHARYKAQERTYFYRLLSGPEPLSSFEKDRAWHVPEELNLPAMQVIDTSLYGLDYKLKILINRDNYFFIVMQEACRVLVGQHDFSSFRSAGCQAKSPIRTLDELTVTEVIPSPYFPSVMDRKQNEVSKCATDCHLNSVPSIEKAPSKETLGFGQRRRHCCLVITARARSFLYHQVRLLVGVLKAVGAGSLTISDVERILNAKDVTAASPMAPSCGLYLGEVKYDLP